MYKKQAPFGACFFPFLDIVKNWRKLYNKEKISRRYYHDKQHLSFCPCNHQKDAAE